MKILSLSLVFLFGSFFSFAQTPTYTANRINSVPKIDGDLNDAVWANLPVASDYKMSDPVEYGKVTFNTEVKIAYDNTAIYIGLMMYDTAPDSIFHELGNRDDGGSLRADNIRVGFDTYNTQQDAYVFNVTASGVQSDQRFSDQTYDGVWQSAVKLLKNGWSAEIKIPYSALRFPSDAKQTWGLQLTRYIARSHEFDQWALTPKKESNSLRFWGKLEGLEDIKAPLRLSLTPYVSVIYDQSPEFNDMGEIVHKENGDVSFDRGQSYSGGADLKYGLDERFTLDMTLLPDFTQVKSDNKVKNLSAFETVYQENRSFFKEGTDLFSKGNLFYSRRIGRTPSQYYGVSSYLNDGDVIVTNPDKAKLLNAAKLSGRTNKKLGIGLFNAITDNTYATVRNADGSKRKILTEPFTNYNIFVLDQQLKNNGDVYAINTNTMRDGSATDADVSGTGFYFQDKNAQYAVSGNYSNSYRRMHTTDETGTHVTEQSGNYFDAGISKISGAFQAMIYEEYADKNYNKNDLGRLSFYDYSASTVNLSYNKYEKFWRVIKECYNSIGFNQFVNPSTGLANSNEIYFNAYWLFTNYFGASVNLGGTLSEKRDKYEPRYDGRYFIVPTSWYSSLNFNTNYNKPIYLEFGGRTNNVDGFNSKSYGYYVAPIIRFSDKLSLRFSHFWDNAANEVGFANFDDNYNSVFGSRNLRTITNESTLKYLFKNDMSINITARHYWSKGEYNKYFLLLDNGKLTDNPDYIVSNNFNSNYFNLDVVYSWQFSPGSSFILTVKNSIEHDESGITASQLPVDYFHDTNTAFSFPKTTTVAIKVLYYLDYNYLRKKSS